MADTVFLEGLELYCVLGVHQWERHATRRVRLDLEIEHDCTAAAGSDDVGDALDYHAAAKIVQRLVEGSSFRLVETLAERVAGAILEAFPGAAQVRVRVRKPDPVRWVAAAGVEIVRARDANTA